MEDILVFSHMMKTAGTSLSKQLIEHFGKGVHIVPGGLFIEDDYYNNELLQNDYLKKKQKLKVLIGHPVRPYINFDIPGRDLKWFTFLRDPEKRYLSHYLHQFHQSSQFIYKRYRAMKDKSIVEWEKVDQYANYQCKFLSGEANAQKAIDILESKFSWVGVTEEYQEGLQSFKTFFNLSNFYTEEKVSNKSLSDKEAIAKIKQDNGDFIIESNTQDRILYDYVVEHIWPKFKNLGSESHGTKRRTTSSLSRKFNFLEFQIDRKMHFSQTKLTPRNIRKFYNRWLKK